MTATTTSQEQHSLNIEPLRDDVQALYDTTETVLRQNIFDNTGRLGNVRLLPETSQQIVDAYLQMMAVDDASESLAEQMPQWVELGLGPKAALEIADAIYQTSVDILSQTNGQAATVRKALRSYRQAFLHEYMAVREKQIVAARENTYRTLTAVMDEQIQREHELRTQLEAQQETLLQRTQKLEATAQIGTALSAMSDLDRILQQAVNLTKGTFDLYHAHIYLLNPAQDELILTVGAGEIGQQMVAEGHRIPLQSERSLVARTGRDRQAIRINDTDQEPHFLPHPLLPHTRAELAVPMVVRDDLVGVLDIQADEVGFFTQYDTDIQTLLGTQIAIAIENARSQKRSEQAVEELNRLNRRLTREGWEEYAAAGALSRRGFVYEAERLAPPQPLADAPAGAQTFDGNGHHVDHSLSVHGQPIGRIAIEHEDEEDGDESIDEEEQIIAAIAEQLSARIENLRLSQQTEQALAEARKRSEELTLLNRVVTDISATLDLRESLQIVTSELVQATAGDQARVALLNEGKTSLTIVAEEFDETRTPSAMGLEIPVEGNPLTEQVLATRKAVIVENAQTDPLTAPIQDMIREQGIETMIVMPILAGNEIIGTVGVDILEEGHVFTNEEMRVAETIVLQAATAIQNAHLFEQVQEALAETETLYRASQRINEAGGDLQDLVAAVMEAVPISVVNRGVLVSFERDPAGELEAMTITANWHSGTGEAPTPIGTRYPKETFQAVGFVQTEESLFINNPEDDERLDPPTLGVFRQLQIEAMAVLPLWTGGQQLGALLIEAQEPHEFSSREIQAYRTLARQMAVALDNQRLFAQTQQALADAQTLYEASAQLNEARTYDDILTALRQHTILGQNAQNVSLNYFDRPWTDDQMPVWVQVLTRWSELPAEAVQSSYRLTNFPSAEQILTADAPFIIEDVAADTRIGEAARALYAKQFGARSTIFVPFVVGGQWIGYTNAIYQQETHFPEDEVRRLMVLAGQAAVAIQSIRLLEEAQNRARREQILRQITAEVRSSTDVDTIMKTAVREVGRALGREAFVYLESPQHTDATVTEEKE